MASPNPTALLGRFSQPCHDCGMPIMWAWTNASGRTEKMPVDATPAAQGNVLVYQDGRRLVCDVIGTAAERRRLILGGWPLHRHHRLMCPNADRWARRGKQSHPAPRETLEAPEDGLW